MSFLMKDWTNDQNLTLVEQHQYFWLHFISLLINLRWIPKRNSYDIRFQNWVLSSQSDMAIEASMFDKQLQWICKFVAVGFVHRVVVYVQICAGYVKQLKVEIVKFTEQFPERMKKISRIPRRFLKLYKISWNSWNYFRNKIRPCCVRSFETSCKNNIKT